MTGTGRAWAAILAAFAVLMGGCATLPDDVERTSSLAVADDGTTALGRLVAASRPAGTAPDHSGFRLLPSANHAFAAREELIRHAERSIDAQYYLLRRDQVGQQLLRDLADAARRGVRVRLLIDDLYSGGEEAVLAALAELPHVEVRIFNPLPVRGRSILLRLLFSRHQFARVNHRMHNKVLVVDGAVSVTGGRNIADEYFMTSGVANFIDLDVLATGPVVADFEASFDAYWNSPHVYPAAAILPRVEDPETTFAVETSSPPPPMPHDERDPLGQTPVEQQIGRGRLDLVFAPARVFADSPDKVVDTDTKTPSATMRNTLAVIGAARSEAILVSPYFIPGDVGMPMIRAAAAAGIRTVLYTNALGATDEPLVHRRYARYRKAMLELGVVVYEISPVLARDSGDFGNFGRSLARLHAKAALIDRRWVFIGSMNLDGRSAVGNTEVGMVIDSPQLAQALYGLVDRDRHRSMYRVRLGPDDRVEWVSSDRNGREAASTDEPDDHWWERLRTWLLQPFIAEELL